MEIGLTLLFKKEFKNFEYEYNLFMKYAKFIPKTLLWGTKMQPWNSKKHLEKLKSAGIKDRFQITGHGGYLSSSNLYCDYRTICLIQKSDCYSVTTNDILSLVDSPDFLAAFVYNNDYESVQSGDFQMTHNSDFDFSAEILNSIKNTPYKISIFSDNKEYDTRFNPGCRLMTINFKIIVAQEMWFGKHFFEYVPKQRLLSFAYASEVTEVKTDVVYIKLYDDIQTPYTPDAMFRQWKFREWLNFDELEKKYGRNFD
jgi:hypothetical protein